MKDWRNNLADYLTLAAKKVQLRQDKNKKKKKKSKKQSQQQKQAIEDLKEILKNILFCNQKYQNIKKNLIKICDKIDSSEMLYSILNPLIDQYIKELLKQDLLHQSSLERHSEQMIVWLQEIKQTLYQIQEVYAFVIQNTSESLNLFEKLLIYMIYNRPELLQIFVFWQNNALNHPKKASFIKMILSELPDLDEIELFEKNKQQNGQKKQIVIESMKQILDQQEEKVDKLIHYIQNMTFKADRIKVNLDPHWLQQFLKKQKINNNNNNSRSGK